jgi:hypothetical protein
MILQKLKSDVENAYLMAEKYYTILSALNDLHLTQREIQLIAFTAVRGNMSYANIREEFCKKHSTTSPTINNIISHLKKMGIMIKEGNKVKVNPVIVLNFQTESLLLQIQLNKKLPD